MSPLFRYMKNRRELRYNGHTVEFFDRIMCIRDEVYKDVNPVLCVWCPTYDYGVCEYLGMYLMLKSERRRG